MSEHAEVVPKTLDVMILSVLSGEPRHGFGIARVIEQRSGGRLSIEEGSLYPALRRLEAAGQIEGAWQASETGRRARFYALTDSGSKRLGSATRQWQIDAGAVFAVLGLRPGVSD